MDVLGKALMDYYRDGQKYKLWSNSSLGSKEEVPLTYFFRTYRQMPVLEQIALGQCRGAVLDIGCGAGSHCLYLQERGLDCTGLDISRLSTEVSKLRGVSKLVCENIMTFGVGKYDTLLLLMNGIGLAGNLKGLRNFLKHLLGLLNPGGQILLDSSDIIYMFEADEDSGVWVPGDVSYYGEVTYQWEYNKKKSKPFPWLFVDYHTLAREAAELGISTELVDSGAHYEYLARLIPGTYQKELLNVSNLN